MLDKSFSLLFIKKTNNTFPDSSLKNPPVETGGLKRLIAI